MKVLLLNPSNASYRDGFYKELSKLLDIKFIHYFKDSYGAEGTNYEILKGEYSFPGYARGFTPALIPKLWTEDYDIIINSDPCSFAAHIAYPIAKARKKKFVTWTELWHFPESKASKLVKPYIKQIIKGSDLCIVSGTKSEQLMKKFGAKKIVIAPDSSFDITKQKLKKIKLPKRYILHVGKIREQKGIIEIIYAFDCSALKNDNVHLIFVGNDAEPEYTKIVKEYTKNNKMIHFKGFVPWQELRAYYEGCLFYVLGAKSIPGTVDPVQSWEMTLNEAMSASKAMISTDVVAGAFDLIKQGKNGFIVPENDIIALTKAMEKLYNANLEKMGRYSRKLYKEKFNHKNMAKKFAEAIKHV